MNKGLKCFILGAVCGSLFAGISAVAKNTSEMIQANYKDIKIYVDGIKIDPKDVNGKAVEPFIYNGTTYLPVRAVGEAIGKKVTWEGATSSVYLGDIPGTKTNWMDQCMPYEANGTYHKIYTSEDSDYITMGGKKYSEGGMYMQGDTTTLFNLNAQYKSLTVTVGHIDGTYDKNMKLNVYLDGNLEDTFDFSCEALPRTITIPLDYANQLKLEQIGDYNIKYGYFDGHFE